MENCIVLEKPKKPCIVVKFNGVITVMESDLNSNEIRNHFNRGGGFHFRGQVVTQDQIIYP